MPRPKTSIRRSLDRLDRLPSFPELVQFAVHHEFHEVVETLRAIPERYLDEYLDEIRIGIRPAAELRAHWALAAAVHQLYGLDGYTFAYLERIQTLDIDPEEATLWVPILQAVMDSLPLVARTALRALHDDWVAAYGIEVLHDDATPREEPTAEGSPEGIQGH